MLSEHRHRVRARAREERGAVLAIVAILLPVMIIFAAYAIDVGIHFVHRAHLQTEADAAALAAGAEFQYPCTPGGALDQEIYNTVHQYDGTTVATGGYNGQVWATPTSGPPDPTPSAYSNTAHDLFSVINRPDFFNQTVPNDSGLSGTASSDGSPCADGAIDVKLTETNMPSVFNVGTVPYIDAQARVSIQQLASSSGAEPFVEPLPSPNPRSITATLIDESNGGAALSESGGGTATVTLTNSTANPNAFTGAMPQVNFPSLTPGTSGAAHAIGLRLCYAGGSCYETNSGGEGVVYTRVWADSTSPSAPPQVGDVTVAPDPNGSPACPNASNTTNGTNFISTNASCTVVAALSNVTVPTDSAATCKDISLQLTASTASTGSQQTVAVNCPATNPFSGATWTSAPVSVTESSGLTPLTLGYTLTAGTIPTGASGGSGGKCSQANPCTGSLGVVQRINSGAYYSTDTSNSGSIIGVAMTDPNGNEIMSLPSGTSETVNLTVTTLAFQPSESIGSPPIALSIAGNQGNQAIGCSGSSVGSSQFFTALVSGCPDPYQAQPAPGTCPPPSAYSNPRSCAKENPGNGKLDKDLAAAMNCRINSVAGGVGTPGNGGHCSTTPTQCLNPNHWTSPNSVAQILSQSPADPRLVTLLVTNNGALIKGASEVPVIAIADFYITGFSGGDLCANEPSGTSANGLAYTADTAGPSGAPSGTLYGHFVQYTVKYGSGTSTGSACTQGTLTNCIPVLTK